VIQEGSTPRQRSVFSELADLPQAVNKAGLQSPVAIVIGETVSLAPELAWFHPQADQSLEWLHARADQPEAVHESRRLGY
jgi:hypothetical protein